MKTLLITLLLSISIFGQSWELPLLFGDGVVIPTYPTDSLIAYFPFSGEVKDEINGYVGTVTNATLAQDGLNYLNSAYKFSGNASLQIDTLTSYLKANEPFSLNFWAIIDTTTGDNFISFSNETDNNKSAIAYSGNNLLSTVVHNGTTTSKSKSGGLDWGNWVNITLTFNGSDTILLYKNGVLLTSTGTSPATIGAGEFNQLTVGSDYQVTYRNMRGTIDELFIYKKVLSVDEIAQLYNRYYERAQPDYGALNTEGIFKRNANITNATQINAVDYLYSSLVDSGLWAKEDAIYPFVGSNYQSHSYNLKNPTSSNNAYKLSYVGSTYANNLSGGYGTDNVSKENNANTHIKLGTLYPNKEFHLTYYSGTNATDLGFQAMGVSVNASNSLYFSPAYNNHTFYIKHKLDDYIFPLYNSKGIFTVNVSDTVLSVYIDGIKVFMQAVTALDSLLSKDLYVRGYNNKGVPTTTNTICRSATIGGELTDTEVYDESKIIREYNRLLSRSDTVANRLYDIEPYQESFYTIDSVLVDAYPDTSGNPNYALWNGFTKGAMICYNMRSFSNNFTGYAPSPYVFDKDSIDIEQWIAPLDSFNVDYAILTVLEENGYGLDTLPNFPLRLVNKSNPYPYYDIRINPNDDDSLVAKFVTSCRAHNIEPILYFSPTTSLLFHPKKAASYLSFDSLDVIYYNNWFQKFIQGEITKYNLKFVWIDAYNYGVPASAYTYTKTLTNGQQTASVLFQDLYNSVKATDPNCLVIMNNLADTTFARFPFDISSNEEIVLNNVGFADSIYTYRDSLKYVSDWYKMGEAEFVGSIAASDATGNNPGSVWYATTATGITYTRNLASVQSFYNRTKTVKAHFCLSVIPGRNGIVPETQWSIWRNITW